MSISNRPAAAPVRRWRKSLVGVMVAGLALASLAAVSTANAATAAAASTVATRVAASDSTPALWPKLAPFTTMDVFNLGAGATADQQLVATTLEGAYNQLQGSNRLYFVWNGDDQTWLNDGVFKGVTTTTVQNQGTGPSGMLDTMLAAYGHDIKGAIIDNPSDTDTINLATTMAGLDDALVASPSDIPALQQYGIPVLYSFANTTFASSTAAYQWAYTNLLPQTSSQVMFILNPGVSAVRDYIIATKSFVFYLTSTNSAEEPLMNQIISSRPANTPIMGYIADEAPDVAHLSSLGYFLNASDFLENGSDFAAEPAVTSLLQTTPQPVSAENNTVYVSYVVSDGDNAQFDEHHMFDTWNAAGSYLGAVPEGWTTAPAMADFAPGLIQWFYQNLPPDSEMIAGPSGVGYATQMTGANLAGFGQLTSGLMAQDNMTTIDSWEAPLDTTAMAGDTNAPSLSVNVPMAFEQIGNTAVVGQTSPYIATASAVLDQIEQDAVAQPTSAPVFLEPMIDGWTLTPQDVLAISQALAAWGQTQGKNFVFLTPSELALTEKAYHDGTGSGLPQLNTQAVSGASLLNLPSAGSLTGYTVPTVSGPNLVANPSGANGTTGWSSSGTLAAGTYNGSPDITWSVPTTEPGQVWAHVYPAVTNGDTYQFTVHVAGSGQVFMDVYSGAGDEQGPAINLTSSYQTLTWTVTVPANAPTGQTGNAPQLQVREIGFAPVTVHIADATVQLATPGEITASGNSGYCLDNANGSTTDGNKIQVWQCLGDANQQWEYAAQSGGHELVNSNGKCLDDPNDSTTNGTKVQLWTCLGNANQEWTQVASGGYTEYVNANGMCLDDTGDSQSNGTAVQVWQCLGDAAQKWDGPQG